MLTALLTGFFLGLSLIIAIGAQNAFVLKQGVLRQHSFYIALFCSISDALLIILGIVGISYFLNDFIIKYSGIIFGLASLWLFTYGLLRIRSSFKSNLAITAENAKPVSMRKAISITAIFTFANPHVYLDTMVLIGSISQQFFGLNRVLFAAGASIASFLWFFSLALISKSLAPILKRPANWRFLNLIIAFIMFWIGFNLLKHSNLINI